MAVFATEFPVKTGLTRAQFSAESIAWVRGINKCTILDDFDDREFHDDEATLENAKGETFSLKSYSASVAKIFGVRLELPDFDGRIWRSECVYSDLGSKAFLRVKAHCVAQDATAKIITPKKPHFIKQVLFEGWGARDVFFESSCFPHHLSMEEVELADDVICGRASEFLPCVYVSRCNDNTLPIDVDRLAIELSGMCHVIVEPSRSFSFDLMDTCSQKNPYGGAISLIRPGGEELGRFFFRHPKRDARLLASECLRRSNDLMSTLAAQKGWEWHELLVEHSKVLRARISHESSKEEIKELEELYEQELDVKDKEIASLKSQLASVSAMKKSALEQSDHLVSSQMVDAIGNELYPGEFSDRLRYLIEVVAQQKTIDDADRRTLEFAKLFVQKSKFSGGAQNLEARMKAASRDGNTILRQLGGILTSLGFDKTKGGKHFLFKAPARLFGLSNQTFPSTPSDSQRGGRNKVGEIIENFGLKNLK